MPKIEIETPVDGTDLVAHLLVTHGASQPMSSKFFETLVPMLLARGIAVSRFEFAYMRQIRETGKRRPPPKIYTMFQELQDAVEAIRAEIGSGSKLLIGGKSMGGRIASMMADAFFEARLISGLVCLGYPFHPPKQPESLRAAHLAELRCPALILQGDRDPFGTREEVLDYNLSPSIELSWVSDGDHDFGPRGRSGFTRKGNIEGAADAIAQFAARV